jgi:hypothetical protein
MHTMKKHTRAGSSIPPIASSIWELVPIIAAFYGSMESVALESSDSRMNSTTKFCRKLEPSTTLCDCEFVPRFVSSNSHLGVVSSPRYLMIAVVGSSKDFVPSAVILK